MKTEKIIAIILVSCLMYNCNEERQEKILASQEGYTLTQDHFKNYIERLEQSKGKLSFAEKDNERAKLLDFFYFDPEGTLAEIGAAPNSDTPRPVEPPILPNSNTGKGGANQVPTNLAQGNKEVRRLLGNDIGEMQFDTPAANTFRAYVANSLLTTVSNSYNSGYGSSDYSSGKGQIQFCANGTFVEVLSGQLSIGTEGMDITDSGSSAMPGYWEAAALPNGMFIIIMYSTHPRMLEDSANGVLPFVVTKHGPDFVQLPSGDLYRRTPDQYCN